MLEQVFPEELQDPHCAHVEEEGAAERSCCGLTTIPHTHHLEQGGGTGIGNGVRLSRGRRGWGEDVTDFVFVSHHSTLF